ncbi:MAG: insulinase family protein [Chromatiales bacterium]|jgi:Zn-dependent M16 (insulinase) family peptidase|nr:insulinase family protein [Chromatiales bacterium]
MTMVSDTATAGTPAAHPAFEALRSESIESLGLTIEEYRHRRTGAMHYHLAADNPENVFLVAFRTVPMDSTGVAHILEHTALCGSERYPVRDPFFMMIRRSLNTFMNAFTSSDWTAYPFASQNEKDFYNLMDVYLDAAFFARLDELDFAQEGHRIEFTEPADASSALVYKGVVYNEMKGAMSSPVSTLWHTLCEHLYPTSTYHYNSGGDPECIPDLRYEELKAFYRSHYHPSNAIFMTFGSLPASRHQERMEERALKRFERLDHGITVTDERRYTAPQTAQASYALEEEDTADQTHIVMGWLLGHSIELDALLKAHLLTGILLDNGASPLRHALETSTLGTAPSPLCGLEDANREMVFVCGIEGSNAEHADAVEKLVLDTLERAAREGVPQEVTEAALHQLELHRREITGDGYPYGLQLILSTLPTAIHHGDPIAALHLDAALEKLREDVKDPAFVPGLIRELLLDNPHRVRLTLEPDATLARERDAAEAKRLEKIKAALDGQQKQHVIELAQRLQERQQRHDDPDILPKVSLDDVPTDVPIASGEATRFGKKHQLTYFAQGTNGLVYQQLIAELPQLEDRLLDQLPHYTRSLTEIGCGGNDYLATQIRQDRVSGSISAYTSMRGRIDDVQQVGAHFILSGKALTGKHTEFSALMRDTFETVRFDELPRLRELIAQERARMEQSVTGQGHSLAMSAAASGISPASALSHRLRGLEGIRAIKHLDDQLGDEHALAAFAGDLREIHQRVQSAPRQYLLVGEEHRREQLCNELAATWAASNATTGKFSSFHRDAVNMQTKQMWITSTQVNFCARVYPTVPLEHADAPVLEVLGPFLRNGYLHRTIREQGGAYGGGAGHDGDIAAFRFYSYRDPRLTETLADFDRAIDWLLQGGHSPRQLEEAILGVIGNIDKPGSPAGEAKSAFHNTLYGRTPEQRRNYRARVLDVSINDLLRAAATWLKPERASQAVITSAATLERLGELGMEIQRL